MPGLFSLLNSTATALNAQSQAIAVTGNNIANVNNSNYSRETVTFQDSAAVQTDQGLQPGPITVDVQQVRDAALDQMVRQEASLTSGYGAEQNVLNQAQAALGENITNSTSGTSSSTASTTSSGLSSALNDFFNAFQAFATSPTDAGARQSLIQSAGVLTDRFQTIAGNLAQTQADAGAEVGTQVDSANTLLQQIAQLNGQIAAAEVNSPGSALSLRDEREGALEQLAGYLPISVTEGANGEDRVSTTDSTGSTVTLVSAATVPNTLAYAGGAVSAVNSTTQASIALGLSSGSIQGAINAGTGPVQTLIGNVDSLASQIVSSVNAAYNPSGAAGGNFFDPAGVTGGTIALASNLTPTSLQAGTGAAGDNSVALAVASLANTAFSTAGGDAIDGTFTQFYSGAVSNLGQSLDTINNQVTDQQAVQTIINNQRTSLSGVSVDEEMSNLMTYQRAYQASSEVFSVVNSLLNNLLTNLSTVSS